MSEGDDPIKVVVRSRPLNREEKMSNTPSLVSCDQERGQVNVSMKLGSTRSTKNYNFDMVFGQYATQADVYNKAVQPIVEEVLLGYNCTVFAYGQTGTGKTHTMEGVPEDSELMGIIPRAVANIFDCLEATGGTEYTVKVSFLELYNEELQDLLSATDDIKLRILDDKSRMGTGVACHNLEEVMVKKGDDILAIMQRSMCKRQTASTNLNKTSSRSHCIFTMTVHIKETTPEGEDLLKVGKLNLVDLAGSECVGRSGATNMRAREAGNINKSLLTLGRVISALVEKTPHIPYRDSKLTRLLQESLGGRAKTCIIATVAPSVQCLDETLSTLDYASRAKNIKNKPEANQKMTKRAALKDYAEDIERLRLELASARAKEGVYLAESVYNEMVFNLDSQKNQVVELEGLLEERLKEHAALQEMFTATSEALEETTETLTETQNELSNTQACLAETEEALEVEKVLVAETKHLVVEHQKTEAELQRDANDLHETIEATTKVVHKLHAKVDRKIVVENHNLEASETFLSGALESLEQVTSSAKDFCASQTRRNTKLLESVALFTDEHKSKTLALLGTLNILESVGSSGLDGLSSHQVDFCQGPAIRSWDSVLEVSKLNAASQLEAIANSQKNIRVPMKAIILELIGEQTEQLAKHTKAVQEYLSKTKSQVEEFSSKHQNAVKKVSELVRTNADKSKLAVEQHTKQVTELLSTEKQRQETASNELSAQILQMFESYKSQAQMNLDSVLTRVHADNAGILSQLAENEKATQDSISPVLKESHSWFAQQVASIDDVSTVVRDHELHFNKSILAVKVKSNDALSRVDDEGAVLSQMVNTMESQTNDMIVKSVADIRTHSEAVTAMTLVAQTKVVTAKETAVSATNSQQGTTATWCSKRSSDALETLSDVSSFDTQHENQISDVSAMCETYVEEKLTKDIATGATPKKTSFPYKKTIAKTLPHEEILELFRANPPTLTFDAVEEPSEDDEESNNTSFDECKENMSFNIMPTTDIQVKHQEASKHENISNEETPMDISEKQILNLKVSELRQELSARNMSQLGNKSVLQSRLIEAIQD